jgi:putative redox protein
MDYKLEYLGNLRTKLTHLRSNTVIQTDAPVDNNGKGEAFSPTDMVSAALAACMVTMVGIKAEQMDLGEMKMNASISKVMLSDPRRIGTIGVELHIQLIPERDTPKNREILKRTALTCPVAQSLDPKLNQDIKITFD